MQGYFWFIQRFLLDLLIELNPASIRTEGYTMLDLATWLQAHDYDSLWIEDNGALPDLNLAPFENNLASAHS